MEAATNKHSRTLFNAQIPADHFYLKQATHTLVPELSKRARDCGLEPITDHLFLRIVFGFDPKAIFSLNEQTGELTRNYFLPSPTHMAEIIHICLQSAGIIQNGNQVHALESYLEPAPENSIFIELRAYL